SVAKKFLRMNEVCKNDNRVYNVSILAYHDDIKINGEVLDDETLLILLNKPQGYNCSNNVS
ncbi:16S rRNA pseudouridine(516) synthase, partial [Aliarcobacter butzleri]